MSHPRKVTNRLIELIENGTLSPQYIINACLNALSEDDVKEMVRANEIPLFDDDEDDDE